jgi:ubiquinol-cytochrome c reductase cytochrome b subunit
MFHLYRYGKGLQKSNIEVISSRSPGYGLASLGNRLLGKDTSRKALTTTPQSGPAISSLPSNASMDAEKEKAVETEIKTGRGSSSSSSSASSSATSSSPSSSSSNTSSSS